MKKKKFNETFTAISGVDVEDLWNTQIPPNCQMTAHVLPLIVNRAIDALQPDTGDRLTISIAAGLQSLFIQQVNPHLDVYRACRFSVLIVPLYDKPESATLVTVSLNGRMYTCKIIDKAPTVTPYNVSSHQPSNQ